MAKAKRVAVVTGGEAGIGLEICRRLAEAGARVVLTDILVNAYSSAEGAGEASRPGGATGFGLSDEAAGMLRTGRGFGELMRRGGYGRIVNVSSDAALPEKAKSGDRDHIVYAAVNAATRVLAVDCEDERTDVKVNAVCVRAGKRFWATDAETVVKLALLPPEGPTGTLFWAGEPLEV